MGQARRSGPAITRYYYLKDHLGTNRMTVRGDSTVLADDFSGTLSQWTTAMGSGFSIQSGELVNSSGGDNVLINASGATFGDGMIGADVKTLSGDGTDANLVVRYQDSNNFYLVQVYGGQVIVFKRVSGTYYNEASVAISPHFTGGFYRLQATVIGGTFNVWWKGQQVLSWTDPSPWTSGKVGVRQCMGRNIHWDNFSAITFTAGQVYAYDDFYPFGQQMDNRSMTVGADGRYKYTGKERDAETGWDYFGARYYDARVGRWLSADPGLSSWDAKRLSQLGLLSLSAYQYVRNSPLARIDQDGFLDKNGNRVFVGVETGSLGHVYVVVADKSGNNTTYSYGRFEGGYSPSAGTMDPVGHGVLVKKTGSEANDYVKSEMSKSGGALYEITTADGGKVASHFDAQFEAGAPVPGKPTERVVDTYVLGENTCVESVVSGLEAGGAGNAVTSTTINPKTGLKTQIAPLTPGEVKSNLEKKSDETSSGVQRVG